MKSIGALLVISLIVLVPAWGISIPTRIEGVAVYPSGAMINREGKVALEQGENIITISELSPSLRGESLRFRGSGPGKATITGLSSRTVYLVDPRRPEVDKLLVRLKKLKAEEAGLEGQLEILEKQNDFLNSLQLPERSTGIPAPEVLGRTIDFIGSAGLKLLEENSLLGKKLEEVDLKITQAEMELDQLGGEEPQTRQAIEVTVNLEASKAGEYDFSLSYLVPGASWRPLYDARGFLAEKKVDLSWRAEVRQNSGENWEGVKLSLSTARPTRGSTPPEPSPWYLNFPPPPQPRRIKSKAAPRAAFYKSNAGVALADEEADYFMAEPEAEMVDTGTAVSFIVPRTQDIPSDGEFHGMLVNRREFEGKFEYLAIPRLSESVYLEAVFTNDQDFPYLPGKINIFNGDDFVGTSRFKGAAPGQKAKLYLGVDERIKVERILVKEDTEQGGLFRSGTAYRSYSYLIKVQNFSTQAASVAVLDQIPISQQAEIKVSLDEVDPVPLKKWEEMEPGFMKWVLSLASGGRKDISYQFTVQYPADKTVRGL